MRMEGHARTDGVGAGYDAYNSHTSAMHTSIESFCRSYPDKPRWLVLGDMRELGALASAEHEELGRWIVTQRVARVFLYGRDTRHLLRGLSASHYTGTVERFQKKRYLIAALNTALQTSPKPAILCKASRRLALE